MSEQANIPAATPADDVIERQERVEYVVAKMLGVERLDADSANDVEFAKRGTAVIASPAADAAALKTAVDEIRAALTASGVTA